MEKNSNLYSLSYGFRKQFQKKLMLNILYILLLVIFINVLLVFFVFPVSERSGAMSPDIPGNSLVLCTPIIKNIERGDVFLVDKTKNDSNVLVEFLNTLIRFLTFQKKGLEYDSIHVSSEKTLRRVVGLPGDTIFIKDYVVYVKPKGEDYFLTEFELSKKSYNIDINNLPKNWDESIGIKSFSTPVILGINQYFLLADDRLSCMDSRYWGFIEKSELTAKSILIYFPFSKIKML